MLADALFRVVLQMQFRRRHDKLESCVSKIVANLMEVRGDISHQGMIAVADRGYARRHVLNALMAQGLCCFSLMPEFMLKCHPIVGKSYFKVASFIGGDSDDDDGNGVTDEIAEEIVVYDRPSEFVMDDSPTLGPGVKVSKARYKPHDRTIEKITGIAVREYGNAKHSKVVRFMCSMRSLCPSRTTSVYVECIK